MTKEELIAELRAVDERLSQWAVEAFAARCTIDQIRDRIKAAMDRARATD